MKSLSTPPPRIISTSNAVSTTSQKNPSLSFYLHAEQSEKKMNKENIHVVLMEKDEESLNQLQNTMALFDQVIIEASFTSIKKAINYFSTVDKTIDLIISEIEIKDGSVFSLFEILELDTPVIFVTHSYKHFQKAFLFNCLDFVVKPLAIKDIVGALSLYSKHKFQLRATPLLPERPDTHAPQRIIGKTGLENVVLMVDDIAAFYTQNSLVYAISRNNKKILVDKKLNLLQAELANAGFFRISRKFLINIQFIKGYKPHKKVKLLVYLKDITIFETIEVSQDYTPAFKKWIETN